MISNEMPFDFKRLQFPERLAFAMAIKNNKGSPCGINFENSCFSHVKLCITCSPCQKIIGVFYLRAKQPNDKWYIVYRKPINKMVILQQTNRNKALFLFEHLNRNLNKLC